MNVTINVKKATHDRQQAFYPIIVGDLAETWQAIGNKKIIIICDQNTARYCLPVFLEKTKIKTYCLIETEAGELHKNVQTCQYIWSKLLALGADRNTICINIGGGVIGDMGGFCAATYKRGIAFIQVPTTLLSQIDSSIGGKLGVDFQALKNVIGVFQDPAAVYIDTAFGGSLSFKEIRSGFAEMLKHALIADATEWAKLEQINDLNQVDWNDYILPSLNVKRKIVEEDPYEKNIRKALNFGHTIGHAVESFFLHSESPLLHGEAIAIGMCCEAYLSHSRGNLYKDDFDTIFRCFQRFYDKKHIENDAFSTLINLMHQDKKNENDVINFTFLKKIGMFEINQTAENESIIESLHFYNKYF